MWFFWSPTASVTLHPSGGSKASSGASPLPPGNGRYQ